MGFGWPFSSPNGTFSGAGHIDLIDHLLELQQSEPRTTTDRSARPNFSTDPGRKPLRSSKVQSRNVINLMVKIIRIQNPNNGCRGVYKPRELGGAG